MNIICNMITSQLNGLVCHRHGEGQLRMIKLSNFEDWQRCITVECGIPLTPEFIETRLTALRNPGDEHTRKFVKEWGQAHLNQVIQWFETAQSRL